MNEKKENKLSFLQISPAFNFRLRGAKIKGTKNKGSEIMRQAKFEGTKVVYHIKCSDFEPDPLTQKRENHRKY